MAALIGVKLSLESLARMRADWRRYLTDCQEVHASHYRVSRKWRESDPTLAISAQKYAARKSANVRFELGIEE